MLEERTIVICERYTTVCLPEVFEETRKTYRRRQTSLHLGNEISTKHVKIITNPFLKLKKNPERNKHSSPYISINKNRVSIAVRGSIRGLQGTQCHKC